MDIRAELRDILAPFDSEMEVEPYKDYYKAEGVKTLAQRHGTGSDLNALVKKLQATWSSDIDVDEHGLYCMSTYNPKAKWDYWGVGGGYDREIHNEDTALIGKSKGWDEHLCANICLVSSLPSDVVPSIIITPTREWHECEDFGWRMMRAPEEKEKAWGEWEVFARRVLQQYHDHFAVALDVHS